MQFKDCSYNISASFLVPCYDFPVTKSEKGHEIKSHFLYTQRGRGPKGMIAINVWLVKASKENPKESMINSLKAEVASYERDLENVEKENANADKKANLKRAKRVFETLIEQVGNPAYSKKADEKFLNIARFNFENTELKQYTPDLKNYLYLAGLSYYSER